MILPTVRRNKDFIQLLWITDKSVPIVMSETYKPMPTPWAA